jgi:5-methylcytosine-specific restriction endonuclease McrA
MRRRRHSLLYVVYLHSPLWRLRRWIWILRAGGHCQQCGSRRRLTVHHLTYRRLGRERRSDVAVLCWPCHQARHSHASPAAGRGPRALAAVLGLARRRARALCGLLILAGLVVAIHMAPTLVNHLIAPQR